MTKTDKFISCSRCHIKHHNTLDSITNNFGYKRLGDRYKVCIKCRKGRQKLIISTEIVNTQKPLLSTELDNTQKPLLSTEIDNTQTSIIECCVCMDEITQDNIINIKCGHVTCKCCVNSMWANNPYTNMFKCPICRNEYSTIDNITFLLDEELYPILFKIVLRNDMITGCSHPSHLFFYTSKVNLVMDLPGLYLIEETWAKTYKTLINIIYPRFKYGSSVDPLVLYLYKDGDKSFTLKSNKPLNDYELVEVSNFQHIKQDDDIIKSFLESELGKSLFKWHKHI